MELSEVPKLDRKGEARGALNPFSQGRRRPEGSAPRSSATSQHVRPGSHWESVFRKREIRRRRHFARIPALPRRGRVPAASPRPSPALPGGLRPPEGQPLLLARFSFRESPGLQQERHLGSRGFLQAPGPVFPSQTSSRPARPSTGRGAPEEGPRPASRRGREEKGGKEGRRWGLPWSQVPCRKRHWSLALPPPAPPSFCRPCSRREPAPERWAAGARGPAAAAAAAALPHAPRQRRRRHRRRPHSPSARRPLRGGPSPEVKPKQSRAPD